VLFQDVRKRPVGDPVPVRKAAADPAHRFGRALAEAVPELPDEARLSNTRLPENGDEPTGTGRHGVLVRALEDRKLAFASDESPLEAVNSPRSHQRDRPQQRPASDRPRLPLRLDRPRLAEFECSTRGRDRPLADEDLPRLGSLFETGRDVDRIAGHEGASLPGPVDDDLARVHADPQRQPLVDLPESSPHRKRCVEGPLGVVLVGHRCAERRHDCVAGELLDRAAGGSDLGGHLVVEPVEKGARPFRILLVGKRRRADEIREHDRDELSLHLPVSYRAVISSIATWTLSPRLVIQTRK